MKKTFINPVRDGLTTRPGRNFGGWRKLRAALGCCVTAVALGLPMHGYALFHLWTVTEVYSSPDGSVQFVKLGTSTTGEVQLGGKVIACSTPSGTSIFTFPTNLPASPGTGGRSILVGTPSLATIPGGLTPNYVLTNKTPFLSLARGVTCVVGISNSSNPSLQFAVFSNLPTNGVLSLQGSASNMVPETNAPINLYNQSNSIVPVLISSARTLGTNFVIGFRTATGVNNSAGPSYAVQFEDSMSGSNWNTLTSITGDGTSKSVTNALSAADRRFFRLSVP